MSIACLCGVPNGTPHSHFCPLAGRGEPRLEYAPEGTSQKLRDAEAAIQRVRELHKINPHACEHCGPFCEECGHEYPCETIRALEGDSNE